MSDVLGLDAIEKRLESLKGELVRSTGDMLEKQAEMTQRDIVNMLPHHTGRAIEAMSSPDAIALKRDRQGNVIEARVGLLTLDNKRRAFHLFFLEKGRKGYKSGQYRFAGIDKRYAEARKTDPSRDARKFRKVKRGVGPMAARQYFRIAFTLMRERMKTARGLANLKGFWRDNLKNI